MNVKKITSAGSRQWERPRQAPFGLPKNEGCEPCSFAEALASAQAHRAAIDLLDKMRDEN